MERTQTQLEEFHEQDLEAKFEAYTQRYKAERFAIWKDFSETTTLHGPNHLTSTKGRTRVYYIIVVTMMTSMFFTHAGYLMMQYLSYPILTEIKYGNIDYTYPMVTLCPNSPISSRSIENDPSFRSLLETTERFWWSASKVTSGSSPMHTKRSLLSAFYERSDKLGRQSIQHILECQINKIECLAVFIITEHPIYYRCFTLRINPKPPVPAGPTHGIRLILHRGFPQDAPLLTVVQEEAPLLQAAITPELAYKKDGYYIAFHEQGSFPNFPMQYLPTGIGLRYGQSTTIGLEQTHYQSVSLVRRVCINPRDAPQIELVRLDAASMSNAPDFYDGRNAITMFNYTRDACIAVLRQKLTYRECGCFSESYSIPYSLRDIGQVWCHNIEVDTAKIIHIANTLNCVGGIGDMTDSQVLKAIQPETKGDGLPDCPYRCIRKANIVHSLIQRSVAQDLETQTLISYLESLHLQSTKIKETYVNASTPILKAEDLIFIDIHPVGEMVNQIIESPGYHKTRFLSDIGGISGLYVGITMYTIPEMLDCIIQYLTLLLPAIWTKTRFVVAKERHVAAQLERRMALEAEEDLDGREEVDDEDDDDDGDDEEEEAGREG